ncbi:GNAT family N-acetyltransferase [Catenovulum sp. SM1970]|uniref:GNAT family N-acetyltransferase n=1 Tax=Marinifaba aquimaris TaxID=2741323 RepID=UPI001573E80B|nr:GNAT family N-acetyltransferase [Marinifaba aquimaris]NTS78477.1 GNAT family N-acetyltransferase [Marinifaba aquimaris]
MPISPIEAKHWNNILEIQHASYQEIGAEKLTVLKSKNEASPDTCFVSLSDTGLVNGYLLAHPWRGLSPPKLFKPLPDIKTSEYLYLHDMAIKPEFKGKGIGRSLALKLFEVAKNKGVNCVNLVAVQGAETFWLRMGFKPVKDVNLCSSYGKDAVLMQKLIAD